MASCANPALLISKVKKLIEAINVTNPIRLRVKELFKSEVSYDYLNWYKTSRILISYYKIMVFRDLMEGS